MSPRKSKKAEKTRKKEKRVVILCKFRYAQKNPQVHAGKMCINLWIMWKTIVPTALLL